MSLVRDICPYILCKDIPFQSLLASPEKLGQDKNTAIVLFIKPGRDKQQFFSVLPYSCFVSGRYDFRNINMNKQCPVSSAFIGPASLQIFDMTFDKRMACWNDRRLLGALVRQTLIKG